MIVTISANLSASVRERTPLELYLKQVIVCMIEGPER